MNQNQQRKFNLMLEKHLPAPALNGLVPLNTEDNESLWEAVFKLIEHLIGENKRLEKEYKTLAVAASESFYSMATQIAKQGKTPDAESA